LGFMRANIPVTMFSMTVGKLLRYILIGFGTDQLVSWF
jgi:membrane protein YqaA with SNARE-associated domain